VIQKFSDKPGQHRRRQLPTGTTYFEDLDLLIGSFAANSGLETSDVQRLEEAIVPSSGRAAEVRVHTFEAIERAFSPCSFCHWIVPGALTQADMARAFGAFIGT
jgi:hypothetical protein